MGCCPKCGRKNLRRSDTGWVEIGEWNGKQYDREFYVDGYRCRSCGVEFFVPGDVVLVVSDEAAQQGD